MSGGSLDYISMKLDDAITEIKHRSTTPLHTAFWKHLKKVSKALHDFEWMASGDTSKGDEEEAIRAVLTPTGEMPLASMKAIYDLIQRGENTQETAWKLARQQSCYGELNAKTYSTYAEAKKEASKLKDSVPEGLDKFKDVNSEECFKLLQAWEEKCKKDVAKQAQDDWHASCVQTLSSLYKPSKTEQWLRDINKAGNFFIDICSPNTTTTLDFYYAPSYAKCLSFGTEEDRDLFEKEFSHGCNQYTNFCARNVQRPEGIDNLTQEQFINALRGVWEKKDA